MPLLCSALNNCRFAHACSAPALRAPSPHPIISPPIIVPVSYKAAPWASPPRDEHYVLWVVALVIAVIAFGCCCLFAMSMKLLGGF